MRKIFGNIASTLLTLAIGVPLAINASQPVSNAVIDMNTESLTFSDAYNEAYELVTLDQQAMDELTEAGFFIPGNNDALASQIIDYATNYLGRPYRSGAKGPKAFDCSGFTSFIFQNYGISLSPSSREQFTQGYEIEKEDIRPGDLLFFGGRGAGQTVGHVALAVDVDDEGTVTFIHAATQNGIRYDRYPDGGYYSKRYLGARRVLD